MRHLLVHGSGCISMRQAERWNWEWTSWTIVKSLVGNLCDKNIAVLGFALNAGAVNKHQDLAISICLDLLQYGAILSIHDQRVELESIESALLSAADSHGLNGAFEKATTVERACDGADAVLVLSGCQHYRDLCWTGLASRMRRPGWIVDARYGTDLSAAAAAGLYTWHIGRDGPE
jgi:UDPglucose 6-dehydrogenase